MGVFLAGQNRGNQLVAIGGFPCNSADLHMIKPVRICLCPVFDMFFNIIRLNLFSIAFFCDILKNLQFFIKDGIRAALTRKLIRIKYNNRRTPVIIRKILNFFLCFFGFAIIFLQASEAFRQYMKRILLLSEHRPGRRLLFVL